MAEITDYSEYLNPKFDRIAEALQSIYTDNDDYTFFFQNTGTRQSDPSHIRMAKVENLPSTFDFFSRMKEQVTNVTFYLRSNVSWSDVSTDIGVIYNDVIPTTILTRNFCDSFNVEVDIKDQLLNACFRTDVYDGVVLGQAADFISTQDTIMNGVKIPKFTPFFKYLYATPTPTVPDIHIGDTTISAIKLGDTEISKIYLGTEEL